MNKKRVVWLFVTLSLIAIIIFNLSNAQDTNTLTVEANVILTTTNITNESIVSIQIVPDYVYLGDVIVGKLSNETSVIINNTGSVEVKVTSELVNNDDIFNYLQLKNSSGSWKNIGDFTTNVKTKRTVHIRLDLRNFDLNLEDNIMGHKNDIKFLALAA